MKGSPKYKLLNTEGDLKQKQLTMKSGIKQKILNIQGDLRIKKF